MVSFYEDITLVNISDRSLADRGYLDKDKIRTLTVQAMPDNGAWTLVINEEVREKLGLSIKGETMSSFADGEPFSSPITEAVKIQWKDRYIELPAIVVTNAKDVLLGALPLEAMDLIVDPVHKKLAGAHGDQPMHVLY
ncbi:MAG: aspartyl protease family protein [Treponema sp.]|nr:aspartyl protease family protein [Treponema sp.]